MVGTYFVLFHDPRIYLPNNQKELYFFLFFGLYLALPLFFLMVGNKSSKISVISLPKRESRHVYLFIFSLYFFVLHLLTKGKISQFMEVSLMASCVTFCLAFVVNLKIKASLHMMGLLGFIGQMLFFFQLNRQLPSYWLAIFFGFVPAVMWSRIHLKAHTRREVLYGSCLGLFINLIVFYLYYGFPNH